MAVWDQRQQILLRRKLAALNYHDPVDATSCDLVQNLVNDLVHTSEAYRALKQQSDRQQQEIAAGHSKTDGAKRDSARIVQENNRLHVQLIREAEKHDALQSQHYQKVKALEAEISELSFWKHQAQHRLDSSEKDAAAMRARVQELLKLGVHLIYQ